MTIAEAGSACAHSERLIDATGEGGVRTDVASNCRQRQEGSASSAHAQGQEVICLVGGTRSSSGIISLVSRVEFTTQGHARGKARAGGAGIPGFYNKPGGGTRSPREGSEELRQGRSILERGIRATSAASRAGKAERKRQPRFRKTARNFNKTAAPAQDLHRRWRGDRGSARWATDSFASIYVERMISALPRQEDRIMTTRGGRRP